MNSILKNKNIIILLIVFLFIFRITMFVFQFVGIEHDSGWYLGVAKNLAERGIYASYTNTIQKENVGPNSSIHGRFSVQDENGYSYFPAGVTVGPGYIIPQAIVLKIFGNGWIQYRLWPLIAFSLLLVVLFSITLRLGGVTSLIIFIVWLWIVPQFYVGYAFESFSEDIAVLYLLISFLLWNYARQAKKLKYIFFSGIFLSFSILTKNLFLLALISFIGIGLYEAIALRDLLKKIVLKWGLFLIGLLFPISVYEFYRYITLTTRFGYQAWEAINKDIQLTFQSGGSGITNISIFAMDWGFIIKKISIWQDLGITNYVVVWILLSVSVFFVPSIPKKTRSIFIMVLLTTITSFIWYIVISPTGWGRHAWQGIILGMMIVSIVSGILLKRAILNFREKGVYIIVIILIVVFSLKFDTLIFSFVLDEQVIEKWKVNQYGRGLQGFPSTPLLSVNDQSDLINFFKKNISKKDFVYYSGWFIHAEASTLVDKVFYTLDRYFIRGQTNAIGGKSYLIFGPYQTGVWSLMPISYLPEKISELCDKIIFNNSSYTVCILRTNLVYNNPAY